MRVLLLCSMGVSSQLLRERMEAELTQRGLTIEISVKGIADAYQSGQTADVILLTPQVRFNINKIKSLFPNKVVACISEADFVNGNGAGVINQFLI